MAEQGVYLGNPNLKKANVPQNFTKKQVAEYLKCAEDPIYFCLLYTSPSPRDGLLSRMPSSA